MCTALHLGEMQCRELHCTELHYTALTRITLHWIVFSLILLHYTALHCIALCCIALCCIALCCIALHWPTLHCIFTGSHLLEKVRKVKIDLPAGFKLFYDSPGKVLSYSCICESFVIQISFLITDSSSTSLHSTPLQYKVKPTPGSLKPTAIFNLAEDHSCRTGCWAKPFMSFSKIYNSWNSDWMFMKYSLNL